MWLACCRMGGLATAYSGRGGRQRPWGFPRQPGRGIWTCARSGLTDWVCRGGSPAEVGLRTPPPDGYKSGVRERRSHRPSALEIAITLAEDHLVVHPTAVACRLRPGRQPPHGAGYLSSSWCGERRILGRHPSRGFPSH